LPTYRLWDADVPILQEKRYVFDVHYDVRGGLTAAALCDIDRGRKGVLQQKEADCFPEPALAFFMHTVFLASSECIADA